MTEIVLTEAERNRRAAHMADVREAVALGRSVEEHLEMRETAATEWAAWMHAEMDKSGVDDVCEILPQILTRLEQRAEAAARRAANAAAKDLVRSMFRKAIAT
jgi:hypothetical protein